MRTSWTDELLEEEVTKIAKGLGYFPSFQEMRDAGRNDVAVQVGRRGGFRHWEEATGFKRRHSDSDTGWAGEAKFGDVLNALNMSWVKPVEVKSPYDILVEGVLRVDVKAAKFAAYGACRGWFYRIGKHIQSDVIALIQLDTDDYYVMPWYACPKTNITISRDGGKYSAFANASGLLRDMITKRHEEKNALAAAGYRSN